MEAPDGKIGNGSDTAAGGYSGSAPRVAGSKGANGAWQRIASMLPAHAIFIEAFAGGAALTRLKRPATEKTFLYEIDPQTATTLAAAMCDRADVEVRRADALLFRWDTLAPDVVLYCDPPYVMSARKSQRPYYRCEWTDADHVEFLEKARSASCRVVISGYASALYDARLSDWRHFSFPVATRRGGAIEHVWCNFPETDALHETGHVGNGYTDRQRIKRKEARWVRMLATMPAAERAAVLAEVARVYPSSRKSE